MVAEEFLEIKISLGDRASFFHPEDIGVASTGIRLMPAAGATPTYLYWEEWDKLVEMVRQERERHGW